MDYSQILVSLKSIRFLLLIPDVPCLVNYLKLKILLRNMLNILLNRNFKGPLARSKQSLASSWTTDPADHIHSYN